MAVTELKIHSLCYWNWKGSRKQLYWISNVQGFISLVIFLSMSLARAGARHLGPHTDRSRPSSKGRKQKANTK